MIRESLTRAFSSPLLQFFVAGALIFGLYLATGEQRAGTPDAIVISQNEQANMSAVFARTWGRPPTPEELAGLIEARIREELLYREARALGLEEGDLVVRRRMAQKVEFIFDDLEAGRDPTDAELEAFYDETADRYGVEPLLSFRQVYLGAERRGPELLEDAKAIVASLEGGVDPASMGDRTLLPAEMDGATPDNIAGVFGKTFSEAIADAPVGAWIGPVPSDYGSHVVRVTDRSPARARPFEEVREAVLRDWRRRQRALAWEDYLRTLRAKYPVRVEAIRPESK